MSNMVQGVLGHIWADMFRWNPTKGFFLERTRSGEDTADIVGTADEEVIEQYLANGYQYLRYSTAHRSDLAELDSALNYTEADFFHSYNGQEVGLCDAYEGIHYGIINLQKQLDWWNSHPECDRFRQGED